MNVFDHFQHQGNNRAFLNYHRNLFQVPDRHRELTDEKQAIAHKLAIAFIPGLGLKFAIQKEREMGNQLNRTSNAPQFIELLKLMNEYKVCAIFNATVCTILSCAIIALAKKIVSFILGGSMLLVIALACQEVVRNRAIIRDLEANGWQGRPRYY